MYQKAILFNDTTIAQAIMLTNNPKEQKALGRMVADYNEAIWVAVRVDIMVVGLTEKFLQNRSMCDALLATGDTIIAEASPYDRIWGIGLTASDPRALNQKTWRGQNLLGIALMKVRDAIRRGI